MQLFTGGYFGAGWFRDLWRIPEYVRDANNDPGFLADLSEKVRTLSKPPFKVRPEFYFTNPLLILYTRYGL